MPKKHSKSPSVSANVKPKTTDEGGESLRSFRELVETLAIALVLALLFKTFEAEAFVIPTGSMAPTLMGAHKDLNCSQCGFRYQVSASEEVDEGNRGTTTRRRLEKKEPPEVVGGTCPQCRFTQYFGKENGPEEARRRYAGDRILVYKYFYDQMSPQRWAVSVFRFPGGPQTNYIKRLVGLENETLRIQNGNIFVKPDGGDSFKIARKPSHHLLAMLQVVNDNDYVNPNLHAIGWPMSWADEDAFHPAWVPSVDLKSFQTDGASPEMRWLHYRHIVPGTSDWLALRQNRLPPEGIANNPQLITDFCAYNTGIVKAPENPGGSSDATFRISQIRGEDGTSKTICTADPESVGFNWNGELVAECELDVKQLQGLFAIRLIQGGVPFLCELDLSNGTATLSIPGCEAIFPPIQASTLVRKPGIYQVRFANVDEQLRLWINGKELTLDRGGEYDEFCERPGSPLRRDRSPTVLDLTPVSFGSQGAQVQVNHLRVFRDIYYIASDPSSQGNGLCDLVQNPFYSASFADAEKKNAEFLSEPAVWHLFGKTRSVEFPLAKGQFFMLGDNSAKSQDARSWRSMPGGGQYVSRDLMIGQAALVYWPHGYHIPSFAPLAWFPNFKDMRFID